MWFYIVNIAIVATAIVLDLHPNKYLDNLLLLGKLWVTFLACSIFLLSVCLATKIRTKTNTNIAKNLITPKKGWRRIWRGPTAVSPSCPCPSLSGWGSGGWPSGVGSIIAGPDRHEKAAREYMSMVTFDPKTKAVVIDVVPE
jgi:hypothetical protein